MKLTLKIVKVRSTVTELISVKTLMAIIFFLVITYVGIRYTSPWTLFGFVSTHVVSVPPIKDNHIRPRQPVLDLLSNDEIFFGMVLGQSNAGSHGAGNLGIIEAIYQVWDGNLYFAKDPIYGTTGQGSSIWMHLGPKLLSDYSAVIWIAAATGGTKISAWLPEGDHEKLLDKTFDSAAKISVPLDAIIWVQGEADAAASITVADYQESMETLVDTLRSREPNAPIFMALSTRCWQTPPYDPIRSAIKSVANDKKGIYVGADLDSIDVTLRYDDCHFSEKGLGLAADKWFDVLRKHKLSSVDVE